MSMLQYGLKHSISDVEQIRVDVASEWNSATPAGISPEMHEVNLCLSAIALRIHANKRWFHRSDPDIIAAQNTAAQLVESITRLEILVSRLNVIEASKGKCRS